MLHEILISKFVEICFINSIWLTLGNFLCALEKMLYVADWDIVFYIYQLAKVC